jgi:hypothetical protein
MLALLAYNTATTSLAVAWQYQFALAVQHCSLADPVGNEMAKCRALGKLTLTQQMWFSSV